MQDFVRHWDALEALVIRVYKAGNASSRDEAEHRNLRDWLVTHYSHWQPGLDPYWRASRIGGEPVIQDPFAYLIDRSSAAHFVSDWRAMQTLPAAREALNEYILNQTS